MKTPLVLREPYRIFFPLAVIVGTQGVGHWLAFAMGILPSYTGYHHAAFQSQAYLSFFVAGFLMTSVPGFTSTLPPRLWESLVMVVSGLAVWTFYSMHRWVWAETAYLIFLVALILFVLRRAWDSDHPLPAQGLWVLLGLAGAGVGTLLIILGQMDRVPMEIMFIGRKWAEQGMILSIVIGMAGYLGPRLTGHFELKFLDPEAARAQRTRLILKAVSLTAVLYFAFVLEVYRFESLGFWLKTGVIFMGLFTERFLWKPPKVGDMYVWLFWVSIWMVFLGYLTSAMAPFNRKDFLHVVFIGGYSLMIFAIATMVIYSHAGLPDRLKDHLPGLWIVAFGLFASLALRVLVVLFPKQYFFLIGASSSVWLFVALIWLAAVLPVLFKAPLGQTGVSGKAIE